MEAGGTRNVGVRRTRPAGAHHGAERRLGRRPLHLLLDDGRHQCLERVSRGTEAEARQAARQSANERVVRAHQAAVPVGGAQPPRRSGECVGGAGAPCPDLDAARADGPQAHSRRAAGGACCAPYPVGTDPHARVMGSAPSQGGKREAKVHGKRGLDHPGGATCHTTDHRGPMWQAADCRITRALAGPARRPSWASRGAAQAHPKSPRGPQQSCPGRSGVRGGTARA